MQRLMLLFLWVGPAWDLGTDLPREWLVAQDVQAAYFVQATCHASLVFQGGKKCFLYIYYGF